MLPLPTQTRPRLRAFLQTSRLFHTPSPGGCSALLRKDPSVNPSTMKVRTSALMFVVVGLSVLSAATLAGQGPFAPASGPIDLILQKLDAIQAALASLATPPPQPSEVTLRTSPIPIDNGVDTFVRCNPANVSASSIVVKRTLLDRAGTVYFDPNTARGAGRRPRHLGAISTRAWDAASSRSRRFADDIRANMTASRQPNRDPVSDQSARCSKRDKATVGGDWSWWSTTFPPRFGRLASQCVVDTRAPATAA